MSTIINADTSDGLKFTSDTSGEIKLQSAGTDTVTVDSSGNVGIGTSSPTAGGKLDVNGITYTGTGDKLKLYSNNVLQTAGTLDVGTIGSASLIFNTTNTERMRIDSGGNLYLNTTTQSDFGRFNINYSSTAPNIGIGIKQTNGGTGTLLNFFNVSTQTGSITQNNTNVSFNTSSDYRLKENVVPMSNSIDRLKQLKPSTWLWKTDGSHGEGFIAHEAQEVVPEAVHGTKDAMRTEQYEVTPAVLDDDGNVVTEAVMETREVPNYQGIDQSKLVPLLTAALQEAITKIEDLETRIQALENA